MKKNVFRGYHTSRTNQSTMKNPFSFKKYVIKVCSPNPHYTSIQITLILVRINNQVLNTGVLLNTTIVSWEHPPLQTLLFLTNHIYSARTSPREPQLCLNIWHLLQHDSSLNSISMLTRKTWKLMAKGSHSFACRFVCIFGISWKTFPSKYYAPASISTTTTKNDIFLSQTKYLKQILKKYE